MKRTLGNLTLCTVLLCALASSGCISAEMRAKATGTVRDLASEATARDRAYEGTVRENIRELLEKERARLLAEFNEKKASSKVELYRRFDEKREELERQITDQLRALLKEPVERISHDHGLEQGRAAQTGSREPEIALALQLSATLAEGQRQQALLFEQSWTSLKAQRSSLLKDIDALEAPESIRSPVSAETINNLFGSFAQGGEEFRSAVDSAGRALEEFIIYTDEKEIAKDFFAGLAGDQFSTLIAGQLGKIRDDWQSKLMGKFAELTGKLNRTTEATSTE